MSGMMRRFRKQAEWMRENGHEHHTPLDYREGVGLVEADVGGDAGMGFDPFAATDVTDGDDEVL